MIYFLLFEETMELKIGSSIDFNRRKRNNQLIPPSVNKKLKLLGTVPGHHRLEHISHKMFKRWQIEGEWFQYNDAVKLFVKDWITEQDFNKAAHNHCKKTIVNGRSIVTYYRNSNRSVIKYPQLATQDL